jgi:hypothetical protein
VLPLDGGIEPGEDARDIGFSEAAVDLLHGLNMSAHGGSSRRVVVAGNTAADPAADAQGAFKTS